MIVGCYVMHLYCDTRGCSRSWENNTSEQTKSDAAKSARAAGWHFSRQGHGIEQVFCPTHKVDFLREQQRAKDARK